MPAAMIQMQKDAKSVYGPSKAEAQGNIDSVKSKLLSGVSLHLYLSDKPGRKS
jgi:hypothetical protein